MNNKNGINGEQDVASIIWKKLVYYYYSKARSAPISGKWKSTIMKVALHSSTILSLRANCDQ